MTRDAQAGHPGRRGYQAQIGLAARLAVREQHVIAAEPLDHRAGGGRDEEAAVREAPPHIAVRNGPNPHALTLRREHRRIRLGAVVPIERDMVGDEAANRFAFEYGDAQGQLMALGRSLAANLKQAAGMPVNPAAGLGTHREGGRYGEPPPAVSGFNKDSLAMTAE